MKKLTWILFFTYFAIFVVAGLVFYFKYLSSYLSAGAEPIKVEVQDSHSIYFSSGSTLYRISPDYLKSATVVNSTETLETSGDILSLSQSIDGKKIIYATKNNDGHTVVWQAEVSSLGNPELVSNKVNDKNFTDFSGPVYSADGSKLAMIGKSASTDAIFVVSGDTVGKINTDPAIITALDWNKKGDEIVYCTSSQNCKIIVSDSGKVLQSFKADVSQISWGVKTKIFFLGKNNGISNIFSFKVGETNPAQITSIGNPKTISSFDVDNFGEFLTYQVTDGVYSDVYVVKTNGIGPVQLSSDQKSFTPVVSPDGQTIAYATLGYGIYTVGTDANNERKILNFTNKIDRVLSWR